MRPTHPPPRTRSNQMKNVANRLTQITIILTARLNLFSSVRVDYVQDHRWICGHLQIWHAPKKAHASFSNTEGL